MPAEQIKQALRQLHEQLGSADVADPELKSLLEGLDADIHRLLAKEHADDEAEQGLVARIESAASEFAVKHPQAEGFLRQLADALGQIGI